MTSRSGATLPVELAPRPRLRGRLHLLAAICSVAGLVWLVRSAGSPQALASAWIYGVGCILLYGTSATYHVFARSPRARRVMRRADHSMIFVLIAATATPLCVLAMDGTLRWVLLATFWAGAAAGIVLKICALDRFSRIGNVMYIALGWSGMLALPTLARRPSLLVMIVVAGVLYTGGAILFAMRKPRLWPEWFGYHEVWHVLVTAAGVVLYFANLNLVRAG